MNAIIFIGIQASGKSTFFRENFYDSHIRLNLDMLKTRTREEILFRACIAAIQPLVIDNTNPTVADRMRYIEPLKEAQFKIEGYYFAARIEDALARNENRAGKARIPERGIRATYRKLQLPRLSEGFDRLNYVSIAGNKFRVEDWKDEI